ncbi:hypothetical protein GWR56_08855 [Mucilaginibacter sp. 14171R-50]|uniref:hypothetical protein n=1 Tax=Mucilaginibacter sp. 14171R-50 TaxID=2703789 RepID=UPI00138CEEA4|nr:hypothetical protein [Mucilaginibacter sp. 14171R-50]QHS55641.1 hypothetical protein GWR56_08855 [Mucilaginibacter sp. 14171R-50]
MMNGIVDTINRKPLRELLVTLDAGTAPLWGNMNPQQMIEHLIDQVQYTNGTKIPTCDVSPRQAAAAKQRGIYTDEPIPRNVILGKLPDSLLYPDMQAAIDQLMAELESFDRFFKEPGITVLHGGFGPMNYTEWLIWHHKHFTHHLTQFGLIS